MAEDAAIGMTSVQHVSEITWRECRLDAMVLHVLPGSAAEQNIPIIAVRLEELRSAMRERLGVGPTGALNLYLSDTDMADRSDGNAVFVTYRADTPIETVERAVLAAWMRVPGNVPVETEVLIDGLLGCLHSGRDGDSLTEMNATMREALSRGEEIDPFALRSSQSRVLYGCAATSFVGFLLTAYGPGRLAQYIEAIAGPEDSAAASVYEAPRSVLQQQWAGWLTRPERRLKGTVELLSRYGASLRPYWAQSILLLASLVVSITWFVVCPQIYLRLLNDALLHRNEHLVLVLAALLLATSIVSFLGSLAAGYLSARLGTRVARDLRLRVFDHLQHLPLGYYNRTPSSAVVSHFSPQLETIESALTGAVPRAVSLLLQTSVCFVFLFVVEWRLAALSLILSPALYAVPRVLGPRAKRAGLQRQQDAAHVAATVQEQTTSQPVVQAFGLRTTFVQRFSQDAGNLAASSFRLSYLSSILEAITGLSARLFQVLLVAVGSVLIVRGVLTIGGLYTLYLYLQYTVEGVMAFAALAGPIQGSSSALRAVQSFLAERTEIPEAESTQLLPRLSGDIRLDEVSFSYTGEQANLNGVNMVIRAGEYVAIVGPSGCGKSTILNLLLRFYDPISGAVLFDGHDVRNVGRESLRAQIGVVFQEPFLLDSTVRENIRLGCLEATDRDIEEAARAAQIDDFIQGLPEGYDTVIGERGGQLSGGQRQRLAIARALVRNPAILLLDEATSALDTRTEAAINETLAHLSRQCTIISVTHRLSAASQADRIYFLDRGRVVEEGTHEALLERDGPYANWYRSQAEAASISNPRTIADRLRRVGLLKDLQLGELQALAERFVVEEWDAGAVVCREGDRADRFYLIEHGEVEVVTVGPSGEELLVAVLRDGNSFGEMAFRRDGIRQASVRTIATSTFLVLEQEHILATIGDIFSLPGAERSLLLWLRGAGVVSLAVITEEIGSAVTDVRTVLDRLIAAGYVEALNIDGEESCHAVP